MWLVKVHPLFDVSLFNKKNAPLGAYTMCMLSTRKETHCSTCFYMRDHKLNFSSDLEVVFYYI
jgi:hypothetical protein